MEQQKLFELVSKKIVANKIFNEVDFTVVEGSDNSFFALLMHRGTVDFNDLLRLQIAGFTVINVRDAGNKVKVNLRH